MRKLMLFAIGFTIACAIGVYLASGLWLLLLGGFCLVTMITLLFSKELTSRKIACLLLGCVIGFIWSFGFDRLYLSTPRNMDGQTANLQISVSDYSVITDYGIRAEGKVKLNGKTYQLRFYIDDDISLSPGDTVTGDFELQYTGSGAENAQYFSARRRK